MTTINLKDFYYWYTQDQLIEVSDEVAEVFLADVRYEMAYQRRLSRPHSPGNTAPCAGRAAAGRPSHSGHRP